MIPRFNSYHRTPSYSLSNAHQAFKYHQGLLLSISSRSVMLKMPSMTLTIYHLVIISADFRLNGQGKEIVVLVIGRALSLLLTAGRLRLSLLSTLIQSEQDLVILKGILNRMQRF